MRMRSVSLPPALSHSWAKVWRNMCGCRAGMPACRARRSSRSRSPEMVSAPRWPSHSASRWASRWRDRSAKVAVECEGSLAAERQGPLTAALAEHADHVVLEVEVLKAHAEQLGAARAGVEQHHQQRGIAAGVEVLTGADSEQGAKLRLGKRPGWAGLAPSAASSSPSGWGCPLRPPASGRRRAGRGSGCGRSPASSAPAARRSRPRRPHGGPGQASAGSGRQVRGEAPDGFEVGLDGAGRLIARP